MSCLSEGALDRLKAAYERAWGEGTSWSERHASALPHFGEISQKLFRRAAAPKSWKKNRHEWLTNFDIEHVLKRYEQVFDDFWFMGVVPIDFDAKKDKEELTQCLWSELCNVCLANVISRKKFRVALVLNLDPHNKGGSHWVALWADFRPGWEKMVYFDSYSVRPDKDAKSVLRLMANWDEQFKAIAGHGLTLQYNSVLHQTKNSECGMYCIYFIHCCLLEIPLSHRVPDEAVNMLRDAFFKT